MNLQKITLVLCAFSSIVCAQQKNIPLNHDADWFYNFTDNNNPSQQPIHSGFQPAIENSDKHFLSEYAFRNSIDLTKRLDSSFIMPPRSGWLKRKLKQESLIIINDTADKFHFTIDPLCNFQLTENSAGKYYTNTRGFVVRGDVGKKFSFESSFYENQSTFPDYIAAFANANKVIPGQGRWKTFKTNGYDYSMASGYLSYTPNKHINIQVGHGKHFVGDGYRSLLLSDNAFNYPYLRVTTTFGKFQYTNMYAVFMNLENGTSVPSLGTEALFQKKAASFQYLSWNLHKRVQLGLFQGMIWQAADSKNRQNLNLNYFNPVILSNAFAYNLNSTNNVLLGATFKIKILKNNYVYGQYVLDDYDPDLNSESVFNKHGFQLGFKAFNLFKIKNLSLLTEYNQVRPFTYAALNPDQSYSQYNQPLAHPLGANFKELSCILKYRYKDFVLQFKNVTAYQGKGDLTSLDGQTLYYGDNIFISDYYAFLYPGFRQMSNVQNQGAYSVRTINTDGSISYIINPITNMNISIGMLNRKYDVSSSIINTHSSENYAYISFKTSLSNIYYDF